MIDLDRESDPERLRLAAKLLDAEVLRLQHKLKDASKLLAIIAARDADKLGDDADKHVQQRLKYLEIELAKRRSEALSGGSERRPRKKSPEDKPKKVSRKGNKRTSQSQLPTEEVATKLDSADLGCPCCGGQLKEWVGKQDASEVVDVMGTHYVLKLVKQSKYRCRCGHIETALGIPKLTPNGRYTVEFGVQVALAKFCDYLPLDRLQKMMERCGLHITSQTLWDQIYMIANLLSPAKDRLLKLLQGNDVVIADETRWPLLGARTKAGHRPSKNWCIWAIVGKEGVVYEIQSSRDNGAGAILLAGVHGVVLADGYGVYGSLAKTHPFTLAHDWTHVRRYFINAEDTDPEAATPFVEEIGKLFGLESEIDEVAKGKTDQEAGVHRAKVRASESKAIVTRIGEMAARIRTSKESPMGKALTYLKNRWKGLLVYLTNPSVPITSNAVERSLRGPVLGRKNSLGSRSERGIHAASVLYSLIESARLSGVEPGHYLRTALRAALGKETIPLPHEVAITMA